MDVGDRLGLSGGSLTAGQSAIWRIGPALFVLVLACILPVLVTGYVLFQLTLVVIYAIALLGLNILTGYNGQISLGHGAFYAIGAYTLAILLDRTSVPYWLAIPIAAAVCLLAGFLFGIPALRLQGLYLALATFALAVAIPQLLKFHGVEAWTGGVQGITVSRAQPPSNLPIDPDQWLYILSLGIAVLMFAIGWNFLRGRPGRTIMAIRDHPIAAASLGINVARYKAITFAISAMYTGVAGALGALAAQFVSPDSFSFFWSISLLVGVVVGGLASLSGPIFGAFFIVYIPNLADEISKAAPWAIYGAVLIGCMYAMPGGVAGLARAIKRWLLMSRRSPQGSLPGPERR